MLASILLHAVAATSTQEPSNTKSLYAERGYSAFGSIVGEAGDVNGDGVPDVILGDSGSAAEGVSPAFWVVSGKDGSVLHRVTLPAIESVNPRTACAFYRVHGGVDVDKDGVPDILIATRPCDRTQPGTVRLVSGKTGSELRSIAARGSWAVRGDWARLVADADHDGVPDIGILDVDAVAKAAQLTIYSGSSGAVVWSRQVSNECGTDVGGFVEAGDLDGDGKTDSAVVLTGQKDCHASLSAYSGSKPTRLWTHASLQTTDDAFAALTSAGDIDGDGIRDVAVSFLDCVDMVSGRTGDLIIRFEPESKKDMVLGFGWALEALGDIDHDGVPDLAISEIDDGVFFGSVGVKSCRTGRDLWWKVGVPFSKSSSAVCHFGYQIAGLGDVDGDGICDLVVGTSAGAAGEPGLARVLSGKAGSALFEFRRKGDDLVVTKPE
jgi:hypothetical protein